MIAFLRALLEALGFLSHTAADIPADPAGRHAFILGVIRSVVRDEGAAEKLFAQFAVETADFTSAKLKTTNSLGNRHVGEGTIGVAGSDGDWNGVVTEYDGGAPLRSYDSLEQGVRDILDLLSRPLYHDALFKLYNGTMADYAAAVVKGNGANGYVGAPGTAKANNYQAALISRAAQGTA